MVVHFWGMEESSAIDYKQLSLRIHDWGKVVDKGQEQTGPGTVSWGTPEMTSVSSVWLLPFGRIVFCLDLRKGLTLVSVIIQFVKEALMGDFMKGSGEVKQNDINLFYIPELILE